MKHESDSLTTLKIEGMHCASCQAPIEKAFKEVPGIGQINVNLADREIYVEGAVGDDVLVAAVAEAGYEAKIDHDGSYEDADEMLLDRFSIRIVKIYLPTGPPAPGRILKAVLFFPYARISNYGATAVISIIVKIIWM